MKKEVNNSVEKLIEYIKFLLYQEVSEPDGFGSILEIDELRPLIRKNLGDFSDEDICEALTWLSYNHYVRLSFKLQRFGPLTNEVSFAISTLYFGHGIEKKEEKEEVM